MSSFLLILVSVLTSLLFLLRKLRKNTEKFPRPPGPPGLPLIGNLHQFDSTTPHLYLWKLSQRYGPLMSMQLGSVPTLVVSSASMAKEVFKTHDAIFSYRPTLIAQQKLSYDGLDIGFSPHNEYRREMKKVCTLHLFSSKRTQSFGRIREDEVAGMIKKISDRVASSSELINLSEALIDLTTSIIYRITFGKRYDEAKNGATRFHWLLAETQALFGSFFVSDYFPSLGWIDKFSGTWGRLDKSFKEMDEFYQQLIDEHLRPNQSPSSKQENFLDILFQMKSDQLFSVEITFAHIKALLMNIIIAGSDSSAVATVWAMSLLIKNPATIKKVQEEVRRVVGKKGRVDEDDLQNLIYLKAVVKETMRLYPSGPLLLPRENSESCVINGYEIQAKSLVFVNAWAIGRDPESWENPEEFMPERFLNNTIDFKGKNFELIPFGAGRRICPGIPMAVATTELALANLLYSFDWELPPGVKKEDIDMDTLPGLSMHKKNELCLVAKFSEGEHEELI